MRAILALIITLIVSSSLYAEFVTSPLKGAAVIYQVEEGTIVKKGEILYKLQDWYYKNRIERAKIEVKIAEADLEDKKTDIARSEELYKKDVISLADRENIVVEYYKSNFALNKKNLELKRMELELESYVYKAPYDCKVIKNIVTVNSGLDFGKKIMEIEPLSQKGK